MIHFFIRFVFLFWLSESKENHDKKLHSIPCDICICSDFGSFHNFHNDIRVYSTLCNWYEMKRKDTARGPIWLFTKIYSFWSHRIPWQKSSSCDVKSQSELVGTCAPNIFHCLSVKIGSPFNSRIFLQTFRPKWKDLNFFWWKKEVAQNRPLYIECNHQIQAFLHKISWLKNTLLIEPNLLTKFSFFSFSLRLCFFLSFFLSFCPFRLQWIISQHTEFHH